MPLTTTAVTERYILVGWAAVMMDYLWNDEHVVVYSKAIIIAVYGFALIS